MARPKKAKEVEKKEATKIAEVKVTRRYFDIRFNKELESGEEFECSHERAKELLNAKVVEIICLKNSL